MSFGRQWYGINGLNDATAACVVTVRRSMAHAHTGVVADGASIRLTIHRRTWRARGNVGMRSSRGCACMVHMRFGWILIRCDAVHVRRDPRVAPRPPATRRQAARARRPSPNGRGSRKRRVPRRPLLCVCGKNLWIIVETEPRGRKFRPSASRIATALSHAHGTRSVWCSGPEEGPRAKSCAARHVQLENETRTRSTGTARGTPTA